MTWTLHEGDCLQVMRDKIPAGSINVSTAVSQLIDTIIFITIAFYGLMSNDTLLMMVVFQYLFKLIIAGLDTPLVYAMVRWVKKNEDCIS